MSATHAGALQHRTMGVGPARRMLDVAVALTLLVAATPLLVVVAAAIRLTGRGPVIFNQERIGEGGRTFTIHKFRTMLAHAGGSGYALRRDPRVTRVGAVLRALHIDELPQLSNVLRGEMTLVGPRPETPALAGRYPPELRRVLYHRPGMTGPCQVYLGAPPVPEGADADGFYLSHLVPQRVALDMAYLEDPTLRRTVGLLIATLAVVLRLREVGENR